MSKPAALTYPLSFHNYVDQVNEDNLNDAFENQRGLVKSFFDNIPEEKAGLAYAPGKWTLKELLQHVIDTERIFNYRALCFARKESASLPGFDENTYAENSFANERSWSALVEEFKIVRQSTELLYNSFTSEMLNHSGTSNNNPVTVNALGFITVGHLYHHKKIIEERYVYQ